MFLKPIMHSLLIEEEGEMSQNPRVKFGMLALS